MVFLVTLGSYCIIKWLNKQMVKWLVGGLTFFLLSLATYQGGKLVVPLIGLGLVYFVLRTENFELREFKKYVFPRFLIPGSMFLILAAAWYVASFTGPAGNRLKVASIFSYRPDEEVGRLYFPRAILSHYFNHFSPRFLGFEGDWQNARHSAPYYGVIGHLGFILVLLGLIAFAKKNKRWQNNFLLYWLVVSPLPAALTRDSVSSVRALAMTIPLSFFIAYGIKFILNFNIFELSLITNYLLLFTFFIFDGIYYLDLYYNHMIKLHPNQWLVGYKEASNLIVENKNNYEQVLMTDFYGQPYIYYLFYSKYPPHQYQRQADLNSVGDDVGEVETIDNIRFHTVNWQTDFYRENTLSIISREEVSRRELVNKPVYQNLEVIGSQNSLFFVYKE